MKQKSTNMDSLPDVLNCQEVAAYLGLHVRTVRRYIQHGRIRSVRLGKYYRMRKEWVIDFMERSP